jgi:putative transposase
MVGMSSGEPVREPAQEAVDRLLDQGFLEEVMAKVDEGGVQLTGEGGFLPELVKRVLEAGLQAELTDHLGYEKHDRAGHGSGNSRNGFIPKRLGTEVGDVDLITPRDRNSSFEPQLVPKGTRRLGGLSDMIISLYAGGMTIRDIQAHLERTLGTQLSHETISNITDAVAEEVKAWQSRPLESIYPIMYLDALVVKVKESNQVRNKAAHIAVGVDCDGIKHVLGIWVQTSEGAKFWAGVLAELRNRGMHDVLIACVDGLTGFPEAIEATFPNTVVQTCVVHLIRASMRFISHDDRKSVAAALRPIYTAATAEAAAQELDTFEASKWGKKYPATVRVWRDAWERFIPFLEFPPEARKILYTTNASESLNYQLRKIIKNRGHFPNDDAVVKLLWLAIRDIEDKRARERAKEAGRPKGQPRKAPPRLVEGGTVQGWNAAYGALSLAFPGRLNPNMYDGSHRGRSSIQAHVAGAQARSRCSPQPEERS